MICKRQLASGESHDEIIMNDRSTKVAHPLQSPHGLPAARLADAVDQNELFFMGSS
jgi:hypothetical protein